MWRSNFFLTILNEKVKLFMGKRYKHVNKSTKAYKRFVLTKFQASLVFEKLFSILRIVLKGNIGVKVWSLACVVAKLLTFLTWWKGKNYFTKRKIAVEISFKVEPSRVCGNLYYGLFVFLGFSWKWKNMHDGATTMHYICIVVCMHFHEFIFQGIIFWAHL